MKSISKFSLVFLLMTLCFSPNSYANQVDYENKTTSSDLKTGEDIILTEPDGELDNLIKDLNESTEKVESKLSEEESSTHSNKLSETKEDKKQGDLKNTVTSSKSLKNPNSIESNRGSKEKNTSLEINPSSNNINKQSSSNKDVDELMAEIRKFLKENQQKDQKQKTGHNSNKNDDIKNKVGKVSDVVISNKISKEESEKIAKATRDIVKEYSEKIEVAKSFKKKQELEQEALDKINKSVKSTSKEAYDYINKEDNELTLFDQKNETLVLEIEAPEAAKKAKNISDEYKERSDSNIIKSQSTSLARSPKLSNKKENAHSPLPIILGIILVIGVSISLSFALKIRENKKIKSKN